MLVALIALVFRIAGMLLSQRYLPVVAADTIGAYLPIAHSLLAGTGFTIAGSAIAASRIPPLFPLWLAALSFVSGSPVPVALAGLGNALFRAAACALLFVIARRYFGRRAAFGAVLLYVLDPWEALWVGFLLKESLAIPLVLLSAWLLARAAEKRRPSDVVLLGIAIGVATLARVANGVLWFAAVAAMWRAHRAKRWGIRSIASAVAILSLSMLVTVSPWMIRNWRVIGEPVLTPHFVGRKLFTSNWPTIEHETDGYYGPRGVDEAIIARAGDESRHPLQQDARLTRLTLAAVLRHPAEFPARIGSKIVNMWRPTFGVHSRRNDLLLGLPYIVLVVVSLAGIALALRRHVPAPAIGWPLLVFFVTHLVFRGEIRNRQYLMPFLYAYGGLAVASFPSRRGALPVRRGD